jgi:hypothetical protein
MGSEVLVGTAYMPSVFYFKEILKHDVIIIEACEHFVKQTYRNRCEILGANGKQLLSIPLVKQAEKEIILNKRISYAENWQQQHWRSITSAYQNSPYFEYFEDDFRVFYENKFEFLLDYNNQILKTFFKILRIKKELVFTEQYEQNPSELMDLRHMSNTKHQHVESLKPYYQVFADKHGFTPNLSCLDALFNVGLECLMI